ncbi:enoyl-CoA hydratase/isomerase family protein [Saccharopolyspora montiporae]|nr:enoyl-CoA hydratase/isomerase family protein [Saccharopolyspora sp. HNM0983]
MLVDRKLRDGVLYVTLNRPEALNALSPELREDLRVALLDAHQDDDVRCLVLSGAGGNFSAGGDVTRMGQNTPAKSAARLGLGRELVELLRNIRVPTLAAARGHAVGAGFGLAMGTDVIVAESGARFQCGFIKRGLAPDSAVSYLLAQQLGVRRALYYTMTGEVIDAATAVDLGIAATQFSSEEFDDRTHEVARRLAEGPTAALFATRKAVHAAADSTFAQTWDFEAFAAAVTSSTHDHKNAVAAFKSKTPARFQGE